MISVLSIVAYLVGLILILMPPAVLFSGESPGGTRRIGKHTLGLVLFALGTMGIHRSMGNPSNVGFVFFSALLILILSLIRLWWEKSKESSR